MRMHLALNINIPNRATLLIEYLVVLIFRFIAQFIKTNKIGLTVLLTYFVDSRTSRTPDNFQGRLYIFQGSRTQQDFKANSRTILEIQGRLATLPQLKCLLPMIKMITQSLLFVQFLLAFFECSSTCVQQQLAIILILKTGVGALSI